MGNLNNFSGLVSGLHFTNTDVVLVLAAKWVIVVPAVHDGDAVIDGDKEQRYIC